jgi:glycosyltransferase involved in cell wall biosynthesis
MQDIKALFIPTLNSGVTYWRMFCPVLAATRKKYFGANLLWWQKGINENHPWQADVNSNQYRARVLGELEAGARSADVVVMGLIHTQAGLTTMQGLRECFGKPMVVEADDNVLSCPTYNPAAKFYSPDSSIRKMAVAQIREADAVIVSTPYLKEVYSEFNDHIYVMPNSIDFETWGKAQRGVNKGKITIGWMGGATHDDDLAIVLPAIKTLTKKYPNVEFYFLHGASKQVRDIKGVRVSNKFERIDKYHKYVAKAGFDIGLAPLVDNAFNRAKSNLRWLEYSALGIPCVSSNVGHFAETIHNGVDGLLCDTPEDFTNALESLIIDKSKRKMMGMDAKARVFKEFNIDNTAEKYGRALEDIVNRGQIKRAVPVYKDSNYKAAAEVLHE